MWNNAPKLGMVICPEGLAMSHQNNKGKVFQQEEVSATLDFKKFDSHHFEEALGRLVRSFSTSILRADATFNISLPDPCFSQNILEFEELPKNQKEIEKLIAWRHSQELNLDVEQIQIGFQKLRSKTPQKTIRFLVQSLSNELLSTICKSLWELELIPTKVDALGSYLYDGIGTAEPSGSRLEIWHVAHWWYMRIDETEAGPGITHTAWRGDKDEDQIVSRLKRLLALADRGGSPIQNLNFISLSDPDQFSSLDLGSSTPPQISRHQLANWSSIARLVAAA